MRRHLLLLSASAIVLAACNSTPKSVCTPACGTGQTCLDGGCFAPCVPSCANQCLGGPDGCGGLCPSNQCTGCCDSSFNCQAGTSAAVCGSLGIECVGCDAGSCTNGQCGACDAGAERTVGCGPCSTATETCNGSGVWIESLPTGSGPACVSSCTSSQCCDPGTLTCHTSIVPSDTACGNNGGVCEDCATLGAGSTFVCSGDAGATRCALGGGDPLPGSACPQSGTAPGTCCNGLDAFCSSGTCSCEVGGSCTCF